MRRFIPNRATLLRALKATGGLSFLEQFPAWSGLVTLNYHRIGNPGRSLLDWDLWSATAEDFDRHVAALKANFDVIGLDDLMQVISDLSSGASARAQRFVMITFDDGYRDNFELAFPILKSHRVPAAFFVTTGFLDHGTVAWWDEVAWMVRTSRFKELRSGIDGVPFPAIFDGPHRVQVIRKLLAVCYQLDVPQRNQFLDQLADATGSGRAPQSVADRLWMTWNMVRRMRAEGMSIGAHTHTHPVLSRLTADEQFLEISESRLRLEHELGEPVTALSYPVGRRDAFNEHTRCAMSANGMDWGFSFYGGYCRPSHFDRFDMRRVAVERNFELALVRAFAALPQLYARH